MIILVVCITVGISYAVWQLSYQQTNVNKIVSSCFSLEIINEKDDIKLEDAYPVEDNVGESYTPYKFTVKNTCDLFASYSIALEVDSTSTLDSKYVKAKIDSDKAKVLTDFDNGTPTIEGYDESHILTTGTLGAGEESDEYNLRLWMDNLTPASEATMKKTFLSKIVVTGEPSTYSPVEQKITTLSDAMLANEYQTTVEIAKQKIEAKSEPDFSKTAPIITWAKKEEGTGSIIASKPHPDLNGKFGLTDQSKIESGEYQKILLGNDYTLDSTTGYYTLTDTQLVDPTTITDYDSQNYYFCKVDTNINAQNGNVTTENQYTGSYCATIYKVSSVTKSESGNAEQNDHRINYNINGTKMTQVELESDKSDKGLYKSTDDLGDTYYYRGSVKNNFVKLGDAYWRIIRRNGDGTVRIIYNGESTEQNYTAPTSKFNSSANDQGYVGYMYGNTLGTSKEQTQSNDKPSTIKTFLEQWYVDNIENKNLSSVVVDNIFCNDRGITSGDGFRTISNTYYEAYTRLVTKKVPDLKCKEQGDRFTQNAQVGNTAGNEKNTNPIGLITADEVAMAGAVNGYFNRLFWLYTGQTYWTMSPYFFDAGLMTSNVWFFGSNGSFGLHWVAGNNGVRPVINIKKEAQISGGIGTAKDPFVIKVD